MAPTNPGEAFGPGDPRNAAYFQNLAALEHAYQTTLANDKTALANAKTNSEYSQSQLTKAEPGSYSNNQHRANAGGLLESGINAERRGGIASNYANKRFGITHGLQETEGRLQRNDQAAKERKEAGEASAASTALGEGYKALLEQQPTEPAQAASPYPGGVVPKTSVQPGAGYVKVGQPLLPQIRRAAVKKAIR